MTSLAFGCHAFLAEHHRVHLVKDKDEERESTGLVPGAAKQLMNSAPRLPSAFVSSLARRNPSLARGANPIYCTDSFRYCYHGPSSEGMEAFQEA